MINFLKKIKFFGFDKNPVSHWFWQRITAILMIVIFGWFVFFPASLKDSIMAAFSLAWGAIKFFAFFNRLVEA